MKLQQKFRLAEEYNHPDTIIVIASFPARNDRSIKEIDAVASYTDHFTRAFRKTLRGENKRLVVLAQKTNGEDAWYKEGDMLVCRVWDKGSPVCFAQILTTLGIFFPRVRAILVQFEFHQFGAKITTALFPLFLAGLRAMGKGVSLVLHQVVTDLTTLSGHLHIKERSTQTTIFNFALAFFYRATARLANTLIVHNNVLARRIKVVTGRNDITVIPHGLGAIAPRFSKRQARKILGYKKRDFVVMYFGFLTWYKGADWLVKLFAKGAPKHMRLLLGGGVSPNTKDAPHYQRFVHEIEIAAHASPTIRLTGFVEDKEIPLYFAAADVVVLPYRTLMSSSGPLAMTMAFKKPFLLSNALTSYTEDPDFAAALSQAKLTRKDVSFSLTSKDFWKHVRAVERHPKRFKILSRLLRAQRVWPAVSAKFFDATKAYTLEPTGKFAIMQEDDLPHYAHA